jgi:hypothetical protein
MSFNGSVFQTSRPSAPYSWMMHGKERPAEEAPITDS